MQTRWISLRFIECQNHLRQIVDDFSAEHKPLRRLDAEIERLLVALDQRGRMTNTIVVVTSDHGESFGNPLGDHDPPGHGSSLYPEQVRIPLVVIAPGRVPAGIRIGHAVSLTDLAGFIIRLAVGADPRFPSQDLLSSADTETPRALRLTLDYAGYSARSIVTENLQYIWHRRPAPVSEEIFDLSTDSLARHDLSDTHPSLIHFRALARQADQGAGGSGAKTPP